MSVMVSYKAKQELMEPFKHVDGSQTVSCEPLGIEVTFRDLKKSKRVLELTDQLIK